MNLGIVNMEHHQFDQTEFLKVLTFNLFRVLILNISNGLDKNLIFFFTSI